MPHFVKKKNVKKIIDLAKTSNFGTNYHVSVFSVTFQLQIAAKGAPFMKNHRFSQNYQLFAQTIMFSAKSCKTFLLASSNSGLVYYRFQQVVAQTVGVERLKLPNREPSQSFPFEAW